MKHPLAHFMIKTGLFLSLIGVLVFSITFFKRFTAPSDYMAAIIDKHHRIETTPSPKIIFGGGSNLALGLDSQAVEEALGLPVVNMGLHGGLGLSFMLNELKYSIQAGDIVLLSIEYFLPLTDDYSLMNNASAFFPEARHFYQKKYPEELVFYLANQQTILKNIFSVKENLSTSSIYTRSAFNSYGDFVSHLDQPQSDTFSGKSTFTYRYWEGIDAMNTFNDSAQSKGVSVFFLFPNYPASEYAKNKEVISQLEKDLREDLNIEIINTPVDLVYPDSYFFDTTYHLNAVGRAQRTQDMIRLIQSVISLRL